MKKILGFYLVITALLTQQLLLPASAYAADLRSNKDISIPASEQNLRDLYLFGGNIRVDAPIENDLVVAGGDITTGGNVSGGLLAAGGTLNIKGNVENSARVAGGTIKIDGKVARDLVVAGGQIEITDTAAVGGDLIVNGGQVKIDAPVTGRVLVNGGQVTINNTVGKNIEGNMGELRLGPRAVINGNLTYSAPQKATLESGAVIKGKQNFTERKENKDTERKVAGILQGASIYKLLTDIILSVLFIYFLGRLLQRLLRRMMDEPVKNGAIGLAYFFLAPIVSLVLLGLIWLGIASFLFYILTFIVAVFLVKIFVGWFLLDWYERRSKRQYVLDWKAGVIGPIVLYILMFIPVIGWLLAALIFLVALGSLLVHIFSGFREHRIEKPNGRTPTNRPALSRATNNRPTHRSTPGKKKRS